MPEQKDRPSVFLALLHKGDARYDYVHPRLENLRSILSQNYLTNLTEGSLTPELRPHTTSMLFKRDVMMFNLGREWSRYRKSKVRFLPIDILIFLKDTFNKYVSPQGHSVLPKKKINSYRDTVIINNHIHAWNAFLESGADFFICFEDDAIFKEDSPQRVTDLLDALLSYPSNSMIYVDLAGGFEYSELKIDALETKRDSLFRYYSKPVTNTACCYLLSRPLALYFIEMVIRMPWLRLINADWLMNRLFILFAHDGLTCICMQASPTIFKHGSFTGEYSPWRPS
jgi:hypothetical protein